MLAVPEVDAWERVSSQREGGTVLLAVSTEAGFTTDDHMSRLPRCRRCKRYTASVTSSAYGYCLPCHTVFVRLIGVLEEGFNHTHRAFLENVIGKRRNVL